jgi:hypothetical protein
MKPLYEIPHIVHFFKTNGHDGISKALFYGSFEFATLPEGLFTICICDEIMDAKILYLDTESGHFIASLQFRTLPGFPPRDLVAQTISVYQSRLANDIQDNEDFLA